ncbi:hypothetical protein QTG56_25615 (plasmid) [Rossellomorea sp. AcN35-11]|nr:hypothetical protein [Rossellomorea aquimaris]WJV31994.1 hypothetical protein QTG56_25615 [Rossellomorea sp. AcN35-11]
MDLNEKIEFWKKEIERAEEYGYLFDTDSMKEVVGTVEKLQKALEEINETAVYYDNKSWALNPERIGLIATKALDR